MNFDWINFLLDRHRERTSNVIDLIEYHYKVDNVYDDVIIVDIDVDDIYMERGQVVKLLNTEYVVRDIEYLPHNKMFKYRLTLKNRFDD